MPNVDHNFVLECVPKILVSHPTYTILFHFLLYFFTNFLLAQVSTPPLRHVYASGSAATSDPFIYCSLQPFAGHNDYVVQSEETQFDKSKMHSSH